MEAGKARNRALVTAISALLLSAAVGGCDGGTTAEDYKARALELQAEGDTAGSLIELANAIRQAPDDAELRYLAGKGHLDAGNAAAAVRELSRAIEIGTEHADAAELLATARRHVALQTAMPDNVLELRRQVRDQPDNLELRHELVRAYLEVGSGARAERHLRTLLDAQTHNMAYRADMARAFLLQGEYDRVLDEIPEGLGVTDEARAEFLVLRGLAFRGTGDYDAAQAAYRKALDLVPNYAPALLGLAALEMRDKQFDAAAAHIDRAAEGTAYDEAEGLEAKANLALIRDEHAAAEELYTRALEMKPHRLVLRRNLAHAQLNQKKYADAAQTIGGVLDATTGDAVTHYIRAATAYHLEDYETAVEHAARTSSLSNEFPHADFLAGAANYRMGNLEQALDALEKYVARVPAHEAGRMYLANTLVKLDEHGRALDVLQPLAASRADDADFLEFVGQVARRAGDLRRADVVLTRATALQPEDAQLRSQLGSVKIALGESEEGLDELEKAAEIAPDDAATEAELILQYIRARKFDAALAAAESYQREYPDRATGWYLGGLALAGMDQSDKAVEWLNEALDRRPGHPGAAAGLAEIDMKAGRYDDARQVLESSLAHFPDHAATYANLAQVERRAGRTDAAIEWLKEGLEKNADNAVLQRQLLSLYVATVRPFEAIALAESADQSDPEVLKWKGLAELLAARPNAAVGTFERLVSEAASDRLRGTALQGLAIAYEESGQHERAIKTVERALEHAPQDISSRILHARLRVEGLHAGSTQREADAVAAEVRELAEQLPDNARVVELQGLLRLKAGHTETALRLLEAAHVARPEPFATVRLAQAQWLAGDRDDAIATLRDRVADHPGDQFVRLNLAKLQLASGQFEAAIPNLREIRENDPARTDVAGSLAFALMKEGRLDEAEAVAEAAYHRDPYDRFAAHVLGIVRLQEGEPKAALPFLQRAARSDPGDLSLQVRYAEALAGTGQDEQARDVLQRVLESEEQFPERGEAAELLRGLGDDAGGE